MTGRLEDLDFAALYRRHKQLAGREPKTAAHWDERARSLYGRDLDSPYARAFIARMDLRGARTLLDVGCGAGNIGIALAARLDAVYGMDYSPVMLDVLQDNARRHGLANVHPIERGWDDDWDDVPRCDIVVASRSTMVEDMDAALARLHAQARQRVYLSYLANGSFLDPEIAAVVGRSHRSQPSCMYVLNMLLARGCYPRLDYIETAGRLAGTTSFDDFATRVARTLGELDNAQRAALQQWYEADPVRAAAGGAPTRWAFISWEV